MIIGIKMKQARRRSNLKPIQSEFNKSLKSIDLFDINNKINAKRNIMKVVNKRQILLNRKPNRRE